MSKTIKFNLTLNKYPVRDLDDLRQNFNIDDLLDVYHNKVLHRWLDVRGLSAQLDSLMKINSLDNKVIATELCKIFYVDVTPEDIDAAVYPFTARQQQKQQLEQFASHYFSRNVVIDDYHAGYTNLCAEMRERSEDYPFLKTAVDNLWKNYSKLLKVDFEAFFLSFDKQPLVFFSMLANDHYRKSNLFDHKYKAPVFSSMPPVNISFIFPSYYCSYAGVTDGYWKDIVPKGKKCLVLRMEIGNFIRNAGVNGEELNANNINGEFLILDGIDYKSNNANHTLLYMVI
jgi:hypothetical protein